MTATSSLNFLFFYNTQLIILWSQIVAFADWLLSRKEVAAIVLLQNSRDEIFTRIVDVENKGDEFRNVIFVSIV